MLSEYTYHLLYFVFEIIIQDLTGHDEQVFDILARARRGFEAKHYAMLPLELLDPILTDFSLFLEVFLVAHQEQDDFRFALLHDFVVPRLQIVERIQPSNVVRQENAVRASVKYLGYAFKRLLTRCVPNLELKYLLLQLDQQRSEFHAYSHLVICQELIVRQSMQQA